MEQKKLVGRFECAKCLNKNEREFLININKGFIVCMICGEMKNEKDETIYV